MRLSREQRKANEARQILMDPVQYALYFLGSTLWLKQQDILRAVASCARVAVKACHSSGKTFVAAIAVLWWLTTRPNGMVVTTAPTWLQVERVLWGEVHAALARARIDLPRASATELKLGPNRYAIGLATNEGVRFQGFHGDVLIIIDEAPGVLPQIYEAIEGIRAGGDVRVLALGNPTIASGPFHSAFTEHRDTWKLISISAFDTPNLEGLTVESLLALSECELDANPYPFLTTRRWVKEKFLEWGPGHPLWEARVLGHFPQQSEDALLSLTWLEQAKLRTEGDGEMVAGVDVAGPGENETVLCVRQGPRITLLRSWSGCDARGDVLAALLPFKSKLKSVNVDRVGIGYYMARHLEDYKLPVNDVNVGDVARDKEKYSNRKAQIFWEFRERAAAGQLAGLTDDKTIAQLAGIRYNHNSRGQIVIESKEDARKRGVKSPDRAEAVILAFADFELPYGLIEFYKEETAKMAATANTGVTMRSDFPERCPKCASHLVMRHFDDWKCRACGMSGTTVTRHCPQCNATCIVRVGGGFRCSQCGHPFGNEPPIQSSPRRPRY